MSDFGPYYGVWVNISDDIIMGTDIHDTAEEVQKELLSLVNPGEGDNLVVFCKGGGRVATYDLDDEDWVFESDLEVAM